MRLIATGTAVIAAAVIAFAAPAAAESSVDSLATTEVTVTTDDGVRLGGTIYAPPGKTGLPGLVLVHGSGDGVRDDNLAEAKAFAAQGIAVLAYDKRSLGHGANYQRFANDALSAVRELAKQPFVNPSQVGLWGISEGGWVVPLAASQSKDVAFVIPTSAPGLSPIRTQNWNMRNKLDRAGVSGALKEALADRTHRVANSAGVFAEADFEPAPVIAAMTQPVLAIFGTADNQVPAAESAQVFQKQVKTSLTLRFIPDAMHSLRVMDARGEHTETLSPGYAQIVGDWVRAVSTGHIPASTSDPLPKQESLSVPVPHATWLESWPAQVTVLILMLLGFLAYPVMALVRKLRKRQIVPVRSGRLLAVLAPVSVLGFVVYLVLTVDGANWKGVYPGPMFAGRPVLWSLLQIASVVTVIAAVMTVRAWKSDRVRYSIQLASAAMFVPFAFYWGLLLP